jgi:hypothetical protein
MVLLSLVSRYFLQLHGHLLDNFDLESFERGKPARMVGQQANPPQIQIRQNLGAKADLTLGVPLALLR